MFAILTTIILTLLLPIVYWRLWRQKYKYVENIPGPPEYLFFGNLFEFGNTLADVFNALVRINKTYGPIVRIWEGPCSLRVMLSDPKYLEVIFNSQVHIEKPTNYSLFHPWIGRGLITSTGNHWRRHRKLITPTLHFKILEQFFDVFDSCNKILINTLKKEVGKDKVNVFPFLKLYALDIISETSMGVKINVQQNENKEYVKAIMDFLEILMTRYFSLFRRFNIIHRCTADYWREQKSLEVLNGLTRGVIAKKRKERANDEQSRQTANGITNDATQNVEELDIGIKKKVALLDLLLNLKDSDAFTDKELCDEVNTFFFAGHDTLSTVLSFTLFAAAAHQNHQARLLEEVNSVVGEDRDTPITFQHVQELKFTERFIKEVMRFYPPVPFYERQLTEDIEVDGYKIPNGTRIMIFAHGVHRGEKYYPEPEKFDPDRFLPENVAQRHPYSFIPFSAGPRNCIGQRFAMNHIKTTLASLLRHFVFEPVVPEHKFIFANDAVLKSMNGIPIRIKARI